MKSLVNSIFLGFFLSLLSLSQVSAYSKPSFITKHSVIINASFDEVWDYTTDDRNARDWSVYFYKIVGCPTADCPDNLYKEPTDPGYIRRCYKYENEQGIYWDEKTINVIHLNNIVKRQILAFNFYGINAWNFTNKGEALVEHTYEKISDNRTRLTFSTGLIKRSELTSRPSRLQYLFWDLLIKNSVSKRTKSYFRQNLENIKANIEAKSNEGRIYPYNPNLQ